MSMDIQNEVVLVVDLQFASRVAIKNSLLELGVLAENVFCVSSIADARRELATKTMTLVIADYSLGDGLSTSLLEIQRHFGFLLLSGTHSRAAVANAAELEVDDFLFKPYHFNDLKTALERLMTRKSKPDEFELAILQGKKLLDQGDYAGAGLCFERAKGNRATFSQACAYLGQVQKLSLDLESAAKTYQIGLDANDLHFKCLNGLYQTYFQQNRLEDAYRILKEMVAHFPENPERLASAVYLAVRTDNFNDIETYHGVFDLMTQKTPDSIKHLCAALSVAGHFHLRRKNIVQAMLSFERALTISLIDPKYVDYIINRLWALGLKSECQRLMKQFGITHHNKPAA